MTKIIAPGLRALLDRLIDYAGMFPPASLPRQAAIANYKSYRDGEYGWVERWLVVEAAELEQVPTELDGALAVLTVAGALRGTGVTPVALTRAAVIETKGIAAPRGPGEEARGWPVYCEAPLQDLDKVKAVGCFAKLRTGGVKPDAIPSVQDVAAFILACAERRLPFKATAGLHHPIRALHPLTYEAQAARAVMHGFLNVFLAAAFAWHGKSNIEPILVETDPDAFRFDEQARWRDWFLDVGQIRQARQQFAHSFGSCSFEEPIHDLQALGLL
jgi:hypothetical protein